MEKLAAFLAHEVHFLFALARACVTVLQFIIICGTDNLDHSRFFEPRKIAINGT